MNDLTLERWQRLEALLDEAYEVPPDERAAFLDAACADDPDLRQHLDAMLRASAADTSTFEEAGSQLGALLGDLHRANASEEEDLVDRDVGPYRLLRRIGRGGMGQVYLALRDDAFRKHVAIKIIRRGLDTEDILSRFRTERQILASLTHPNIARLLDGGMTEDGLSYFVMEYVEGQPILTYCDQHRLPVDARLRLFREVCAAVHYAHQNLVVHRDLKPSNILVTEDGTVKLLDFGIAKLLNPDLVGFTVAHTRTEMRILTPEYAAPEQIRGQSVTTASDVYALGVLLYELLAGHRPYELRGRGPAEMERLICETDPAPPSTAISRAEAIVGTNGTRSVTPEDVSRARGTPMERLRRRLSGDLDTIVLTALRKEPEHRYQSADQLSEDIRRHLEGLPVSAQRPTFGYRTWKFIQRHRIGVAAAAALVVMLLTVVVLSIRFALITARQAERIEVEARKTEEVKDFLVGLFEVSDPEVSRGEEITAFELLERGSEQIETELSDQPAVHAEMLHVMGVVYRQLGLFDKALPMLERSLAMRRSLHGEQHLDVAQSLYDLSWVLDEKGEYDEAEALGRRALEMRRTLLGEDHPVVARNANDLGIILAKKGAIEEAERYFREGLRLRRTLFEEENMDVAESILNLAWVVHERGHYDEAEELYREALAIQREVMGEENVQVSITTANLGALLYDMGHYEEAEPFFQEALAVRRTILGDEHPLVANIINWLGRVNHQRGDLRETERLYRMAKTLHHQTYGDPHPSVARDTYFIGRVLHDRGRYAAAQEQYEQAIADMRSTLPSDHPYLADAVLDLGRLYVQQQHPEKAEALIREAVTIFDEKYGSEDARTVRSNLVLGRCLTALERFEQAEPLLIDSYHYFAANDDGENTGSAREALIALYQAWDRPEQAEAYLNVADQGK